MLVWKRVFWMSQVALIKTSLLVSSSHIHIIESSYDLTCLEITLMVKIKKSNQETTKSKVNLMYL